MGANRTGGIGPFVLTSGTLVVLLTYLLTVLHVSEHLHKGFGQPFFSSLMNFNTVCSIFSVKILSQIVKYAIDEFTLPKLRCIRDKS